MELLTLIASFLLTVSFLLAPSTSDQLNLQKPLQQVDHDPAKFAQLSLPRKLFNLSEKTVKSVEVFTPREKSTGASSSDTKQHDLEETVMNAAEKETRRESVEEESPSKSEYFTMDYGWVRRRRPIHNKQIPFVP